MVHKPFLHSLDHLAVLPQGSMASGFGSSLVLETEKPSQQGVLSLVG